MAWKRNTLLGAPEFPMQGHQARHDQHWKDLRMKMFCQNISVTIIWEEEPRAWITRRNRAGGSNATTSAAGGSSRATLANAQQQTAPDGSSLATSCGGGSSIAKPQAANSDTSEIDERMQQPQECIRHISGQQMPPAAALYLFDNWTPEQKEYYIRRCPGPENRRVLFTPAQMSFCTREKPLHKCLQRPTQVRFAEIIRRTVQYVPVGHGRIQAYVQKIGINREAEEKYIYPNYPVQVEDRQFCVVSEKVCEGPPAVMQWHLACLTMIPRVIPRAHSLQP